MNKKGISPLIATVLILGFTVALAAIIMTWGTDFTKRMQESTEETSTTQITCATDVIFDVKSVCFDTDHYNVVISNDGKEDIEKWRFRIYESETTVDAPDPVTLQIKAFELKTVPVTGDGTHKKIEAIPIIQKGGKDIVCAQNIGSYGDVDGDAIAVCV
ncbi:MAG: hypothetical protein KKA79_10365 [Nanoarchaeota archaeon]|nr:hypothetical protein [Nanoarchaeota archaeon]MCG2718931.1 hypothetical protein [Nanoarchaeota archaeon]